MKGRLELQHYPGKCPPEGLVRLGRRKVSAEEDNAYEYCGAHCDYGEVGCRKHFRTDGIFFVEHNDSAFIPTANGMCADGAAGSVPQSGLPKETFASRRFRMCGRAKGKETKIPIAYAFGICGGEGGIRTHEPFYRLHDFQSCALDQLGDFSMVVIFARNRTRSFARGYYITTMCGCQALFLSAQGKFVRRSETV